ncbi:hypothetical protein, partial [Mangrovicoccus sp. HB161399]|uniref:hypothetical protein n=1 Tax=Mangrovicoccus sp. HB161399 TaxID=2720392 RepID=UPI00352D72B9
MGSEASNAIGPREMPNGNVCAPDLVRAVDDHVPQQIRILAVLRMGHRGAWLLVDGAQTHHR